MTSREEIELILYRLDQSYEDKEWAFERLSEGWTNQSYRITSTGAPKVLRVANQDAAVLGVDRLTEQEAIRIGMAEGLAPVLHAWAEPEGHSLTAFVEGRRWDAYKEVDDRQIEVLAKVASTLRGHSFDGGTNLFSSTRICFEAIQTRGIQMPEDAASFMKRFLAIGEQISALKAAPVICHNDINKVNVIESDGQNGQAWIIDWEYAGHGHPLMELARISILYEMTSAQEELLLKESGVQGAEQFQIFRQLTDAVLISDLYWGILRLHIPPIEPEIVKAITHDIGQMTEELNRRL